MSCKRANHILISEHYWRRVLHLERPERWHNKKSSAPKSYQISYSDQKSFLPDEKGINPECNLIYMEASSIPTSRLMSCVESFPTLSKILMHFAQLSSYPQKSICIARQYLHFNKNLFKRETLVPALPQQRANSKRIFFCLSERNFKRKRWHAIKGIWN